MTDIRKLQLEIGGSFFELIEFALTRNVRGRSIHGIYGVNVAKVREVVRMPKINPLASRVKGLAGIFELRGIAIPAVHLAVALGDDEAEVSPNQQIIVTEFSQKRAGFVVDATHRIRRIAWDKVLPPSADVGSCINGMTLINNDEFLFILDLERILMNIETLGEVTPEQSSSHAGKLGYSGAGQAQAQAYGSSANTKGPAILLVDDSQFIRNGAKQVLLRAGFRVIEASDGVEAFELLQKHNIEGVAPRFEIVVTDVEMPRMDGLSFTKKVRDHPTLAPTPIILHTSLSGRANQEAGNSVGANGYVVKNDFRCLFELMREILGADVMAALSA